MGKNRSAIKRARKSEERRRRNAALKSRMKTEIKKLLAALSAKELDKVDGLLRNAMREIYKAKAKGVIHKNKAARKVSRLAKKVQEALRAS